MTPDLTLVLVLALLLVAVGLAVWAAPGVKHKPQDRYLPPRRWEP